VDVPVPKRGKGGDAEIIESHHRSHVLNPWNPVREVKGPRDQKLDQKIAEREYYCDYQVYANSPANAVSCD